MSIATVEELFTRLLTQWESDEIPIKEYVHRSLGARLLADLIEDAMRGGYTKCGTQCPDFVTHMVRCNLPKDHAETEHYAVVDYVEWDVE